MRTPIMIKLSDYKINLSLLSTFAIFVLRTCLLAGGIARYAGVQSCGKA